MTQIISDKSGKPIQATTAWIIAVVTLGYMLPWAVAATRGKSNAGAIGWLNLLLGWTGVGWIVALVMACTTHQKMAVARPVASPPAASWVDSTTGHNPVTGHPQRIDPATGSIWIDPAS
jgi:hypothetical protein